MMNDNRNPFKMIQEPLVQRTVSPEHILIIDSTNIHVTLKIDGFLQVILSVKLSAGHFIRINTGHKMPLVSLSTGLHLWAMYCIQSCLFRSNHLNPHENF